MSYEKTAKKKYILIAMVAILLLGVATVFGAQMTTEDKGYRTISVIEVSGRVSVVKDGVEYSAYPGMLLQEGQEVVTSGNSHVRMVLDDDKYIKLESGSRAVFETLGLLGSGKTAINLERGSLTSELVNPLGHEDSYVVNTPNAVLAVRGTFFRVDLTISNEGDVKSDVMTYGGQVASQRVQPSGEVVEEEVLIDAGYKATINMTPVETHYVVETQPISTADIPDADLVDVYFAAENGHELFVTSEEVKTDLEEREIVVEEYKPVYEIAEEIKKEQEAAEKPIGGVSNTTSASIKANDSQPIAIAPVVKEEGNTSANSGTSTTVQNNTASGLVDGVHVHSEKKTTTEATCTTPGLIVVTCRDCKEKLSETEIPATGHAYVETVSKVATCTEAGVTKYSCSCGYAYTEEIAALGHNIINTAYVAPGCTITGSSTYACDCGYGYTDTIAALGHNYASEFTVDKAATCTADGSKSKHCAQCSVVKDVTTIVATGHTEVYGGTSDAHTRCEVCKTILGIQHEFIATETIEEGTCSTPNKVKFICSCGFNNITQFLYGDHVYEAKVDYTTGENYEECTECGDIVWEFEPILLDAINFPDENFRAYLSTTAFDKNQDFYLSKSEIESVTKIDVEGDGYGNEISVDGGIYDLTGIEYFTSLTTLWAGYNRNLTELDLSQNVNLEYVIVPCTGIETLDLSNCTAVISLDVEYCQDLSNLEISNCTEMVVITASGTSISQLDISQSPNLLTLEIARSENLRELITNGTGYPNLTTLDVGRTGLDNIDFSLFSNVENLSIDCVMPEYDLSSCNNITNIYFYGGSGLESFAYTQSNLKNIHFSEENSIKELILSNSGVMDLDVTNCLELETLDLTNTFFRELNLEGRSTLKNLTLGCQFLHTLNVSGTSITELDLTTCRDMNSLTANSITTMDNISDITVPETPLITEFSMDGSQWSFDDSAMDWFGNLTSFSAVGSGIDDFVWSSVSPKLSSNLVELDLSENTGLTNLDVAGYTNLEKLRIKGMPVQILDIRNLTKLAELDIQNTYLSAIDATGTGSGLMVSPTNAPTVKYFNSNGTSMNFAYLTEDQLNWLNNVEYLGIGGQNVDDMRISDILYLLPTSIKELDLSGSDSLGSLYLERFLNLEKVYVRYCTALSSITMSNLNADTVTVYTAGCTSLYNENIIRTDGKTVDIDISAE